MTEFEKYATNHKEHTHCVACGGCILDPRCKPSMVNPVWCVGCYARIDAAMPIGAPRPWSGGYDYVQESAL